VQVGRSFFTPVRGQVLPLGDGLEMWYGMFQSATLGWKPFVNIDGQYIIWLATLGI
jgi:eukaryotic translation initiation factor 2C